MLKKITAAILAITIILMGAIFLLTKDVTITLNEREAQAAIDEYLAANEPESLGVRLYPKTISIDFKADNTAQVKSDMLIDGHGYTGRFEGVFTTGIDYHIPRLYLDELQLIEGGFQADEATRSDLQDFKKSVINMVERKRRQDTETDLKIGPDRSSNDFIEDIILKSTKFVFESVPIFDLKTSSKTGMVAGLALKDVKFTEESVIVTFNPLTALLRILSTIGLICLAITWFLGPAIIRLFIEKAVTLKT